MSPILGTLASQFSGKPFNSYESIASYTVGSGGVGTVTFSSIPQTYKHLQLRTFFCPDTASAYLKPSFNSGAFINVKAHAHYGNGTSSLWLDDNEGLISFTSGLSSNYFVITVSDFLDYTNTNKKRTVQTLSGHTLNGSGIVASMSAFANNTSAITSIQLALNTGGSSKFRENSHFALYGIKDS